MVAKNERSLNGYSGAGSNNSRIVCSVKICGTIERIYMCISEVLCNQGPTMEICVLKNAVLQRRIRGPLVGGSK